MIPWLIFAVIVVPLVVAAFLTTRRRSTSVPESDDPGLTDREFAEAEAYDAEWHKDDVEKFHQERLP